MARYSNVQTDFSGGLISEYVLGRTDIKRVSNSGRKFTNFFPSLQGPAIYRTGFKHYNTLAPDIEDVLTVDVILATSVPYRVVFTPGQIEIFDSAGTSKDIIDTEYSASDIKDLRFSSETGELYIAHGRHKPKKLTSDITFVSVPLQSEELNQTNLLLYSTAGFGIDITSFSTAENFIDGFAADTAFFEGKTDSAAEWQVDATAGALTTQTNYRTLRTTARVPAAESQSVVFKSKMDFGSNTLAVDVGNAGKMFMFSLVDFPDYPAPTDSNTIAENPNLSFTLKFRSTSASTGLGELLELVDQSDLSGSRPVLGSMPLSSATGATFETELELIVGSTAANTQVNVALRNITSNTEILHERFGIPEALYTALIGDGIKAAYQSGNLTNGNIDKLSVHSTYFRNQSTFGNSIPLQLKANAEVEGDDEWTLSDLSFDIEPFLEKEPESNKFSISQNERHIKIESNASTFAPLTADFGITEVGTIGIPDDDRTADTYTDVSGTSSGLGVDATFNIVVDANGAATVTVVTPGSGYVKDETITILDSDLGGGGADPLTFNVAELGYGRVWYVEYTVDGDRFLAKAEHAASSTNYTLADPTSNVVYAEPVISVLDIEDNAAQLFLLDNEETGAAADIAALKKDGVPDSKIHLRSDTTIFNGGFVDSWVRVGDDRRSDKVVIGEDRTRVRWVKIKEHRGTEDHPTEFFRGAFDNTLYKAGSVYRIYKGASNSPVYMMGPNSTSGGLTIVNSVIDADYNTTFAFVGALKTANSGGDLVTSVMTVGNLSEQKQFDVVECYNNAADLVPKVEEYNAASNPTGNLISPTSSTTLTLTTIANDAFINASEDTFSASDLDRHIFGAMESGNVFMKVIRNVSARQAVVKLLNAVPRDKRTLDFENSGNFESVKLGAWYVENYPRTVAKFEQRRIFAGTYNNPNFIYFSRVDDEASFQPTQNDGEVLDTDAITYALSNRNAGVRWINAAKDLVIGTTGGIYRIVPNQYQFGISPKTVRMELTEEEPCEQQAETVASSIFYPDQSGTRLMEYKYDQSLNNSSSNDVSKLIYPIFLTDSIAQIAYQHTPQPRIWARTASGKIYCLSYHRQEEFYAWSEQDLGSNAKVLDISILHRGTETQLDQVWIVVKRGNLVYTEALAETDPVQLTSYPMLDSYLELVKPQGGTISTDVSARYGAGDTVSVIEDDVYTGEQTLTDGNITLQSATAERIIVGLKYTGELQMMFPTWDAQNKPAYGADTSRIISLKAFFISSFSFMLGIKDKFDTIKLSTNYGASGGFTGFDKERAVAGSTFGVDNVPTIKHEEPYPLTIASIITKTDLN